MRFFIMNLRYWALRVSILAGSAVYLAGQYPGPAENREGPWAPPGVPSTYPLTPISDEAGISGSGVPNEPDLAAVFPVITPPAASAPDAKVSVAELQHPLSRKGRQLLLRAQSDLHSGKTAEGIRRLQAAMEEPSAVPYVHTMLGATYLQLGRTPEAITELEEAVQLLPIAANYSNLGYAHCIMGDTERGEEDLDRALKLDSFAPQTHYLIGLLLLDIKARSTEACEQLQRAKDVERAPVALAVCYVRAGQDEAADRQVRDFAGPGDVGRFWRRWVALLATEARPSQAFGFYSK